MQKGTCFLLGTLLVLVGIWNTTPSSSLSSVIGKNTRAMASLRDRREMTLQDQVKGLTAYNPSKHVKLYQETFNPRN